MSTPASGPPRAHTSPQSRTFESTRRPLALALRTVPSRDDDSQFEAVTAFEDQARHDSARDGRTTGPAAAAAAATNGHQPTPTPTRHRDSLTPLSQHVTVSRMTSTRRYMDQLDEDDVEALDNEHDAPEDEPDRATWHSGWGSDPRDSVTSLGVNDGASNKSGEKPGEPSQSMHAFQTEKADSVSNLNYGPTSPSAEAHLASRVRERLGFEMPSSRSPSAQISPPSSFSSPSTSAPIVRIGPPSPTIDSFLDNPQASTAWTDLPSSPPASPISRSREQSQLGSPPSPSATNRARSQTTSKNFSRPFMSISSPSQPKLPPAATSPWTHPASPHRPVAPRADSLESTSSPNPLDRKSSLGANSSSIDHSGSSAGGHSMSASWEDRKLLGLRQHEEARRAIDLARERSQRIRFNRDTGADTSVEELRSLPGDGQDNEAYGGEDEEEVETSISFESVASSSAAPESPYLAYAAPSPPIHSPPFVDTSHPYSAFSEALPRSPPPQTTSHSASLFAADPRPAPAPPVSPPSSNVLSLPMPGFLAQQRRPSDTPSLPLDAAPAVKSAAPWSPSFSLAPQDPTLKQRNVLRKARPPRRSDEESSGLSAPMSRSGSALTSHSQTSSNGEASASTTSRWSRFRSRSKSRTRGAISTTSTTSTFFDEPPVPPFSAAGSSSASTLGTTSSRPDLRHKSSSSSFLDRADEPSLAPRPPPLPSLPVPAFPAFPSPSTTSPLSHAEFSRLQASRPAFLRAKTSIATFGVGAHSTSTMTTATAAAAASRQAHDGWVLKSVDGARAVQTGLVHAPGEAASIHGGGSDDREGQGVDGEEMERLNDGGGGIGGPASPIRSMHVSGGGGGGGQERRGWGRGRAGGPVVMNRSVSDQGPSTTNSRSIELDDDRHASDGANSLYSDYSIYSLPPSPLDTSMGAKTTTPTNDGRVDRMREHVANAPNHYRNSTAQKAKETLAASGNRGEPRARSAGNGMVKTLSGNEAPKSDPVTPEDFLQVGIDHHEVGELERAAWCFEQSATRSGGCGGGMLMYGLTLRHGWGCQLNAPLGFRYLQMAAESVVEDLDRVVFGGRTLTESEANTKAAKSELVLALHEIGVSYRFGWGVEKNKKMAVSYFTLSADLGDADAQQDVAFCYANGKGCKKDMKRAAHYYRLAVRQGAEDWGLSWIYKPKYADTTTQY